MSWIRVSAVVALVAGASALAAGAAFACELTSFSVAGGSGDPVRPGDVVTYTLNVRATPESPGDSAFTVSMGSQVVGNGTATPSENQGEWSTTGSFRMPSLGESARQVTLAVTLQTGGYISVPVHYDGTPVRSASETPVDGGALPSLPASVPAAHPSEAVAESDPGPAHYPDQSQRDAARPSDAARALPVASRRRTRAHATAPRVTRRVTVTSSATARGQVASARVTIRGPAKQSGARLRARSRPASGTGTLRVPTRSSHGAGLFPGTSALDGHARVAVSARARTPEPPGSWLMTLALALRMSGGGYAWDVPPVARLLTPHPEDEDDAIEAELQALLAMAAAGPERRQDPIPLVPA